MYTKILFQGCLIILLLLMSGCTGKKQTTEIQSVLLKSLEHSFIALMPEGEPEDLNEFLPLKPSVVAWGNDPVGMLSEKEKIRRKMDDYYELGIRLQAVNVWMLTATGRVLYEQPEYQEAACVDIEGNPIVPRWLDGDYRGVKNYWGCTNHPLFKANLIYRASAGITAGANMLHLDDHLGTYAAADHSGGCFCKYCMKGFNAWLNEHFTMEQLADRNIDNIENFDFGNLVRKSGFTTISIYMDGKAEDNIPLLDEFLDFQREAAADFVRELGMIADNLSGTSIPVGVNSWNLIPTQLATSHYADYFANEVSHYDVEDLIPPMCYLLGNSLGKPVFSTGTGDDWIHIHQNPEYTRIKRWIATAYAFGNYFMYSYNKWGFSEETGTLWTRIPVSSYEPFCTFITENAQLFDDYEAVAQVGVLYDNTRCRNGNWDVRDICRDLHYANIPFGLIVSGDKFLKFKSTREQMDQYEWIITPGSSNISSQSLDLLEPYIRKGNVISWDGISGITSVIEPLIALTNGEKLWALPRKKPGGNLVIHLLNQDYNTDKDEMNRKENIAVLVNNRLTDNISIEKARLSAPGNEPYDLEIIDTGEGVEFHIPVVDVWAIVKIETATGE